jgi:hypothetical protein
MSEPPPVPLVTPQPRRRLRPRPNHRPPRKGLLTKIAGGAKALSGLVSNVGQIFTSVAAIWAFVGSIVSVAAGATLFGTHVPQVPAAITTVFSAAPAPGMPAPNVIFVSSDDLMAKSYMSVLDDSLGGKVTVGYLDPSQLDALPDSHPGVVIIGSTDLQPQPLSLSPSVLRFLSGDVKVLGIGAEGGLALNQIAPFSPLSARNSVGITSSEVILPNRLPDRIRSGLPIGETFHLYSHDSATAPGVAVYDGGSLGLQGAQGIAEVFDAGADQCGGHYWPVATQGNDAFWGFTKDAGDLTAQGTQLFVNTVNDLLATPFAGQDQRQQQYYLPSTYTHRSLGCRFPSNSYRIKVAGTGRMNIGVRSASDADLQLIAYGPLDSDSFTSHGRSPDLPVDVSGESQASGHDWVVIVAYNGPMTSETRVVYDLVLDYRSNSGLSLQDARVAIGLTILGALLGCLGIWWFVRRRRDILGMLPRRR